MRSAILFALLLPLALPAFAADPPTSAPAATRPAKSVFQIHVVFTSGGAPGPRGGMGRYVAGLKKSAPLESHITSMEIVDTEEVPAEDAQTRRKFTYMQYYLRLHLDAAGTARANGDGTLLINAVQLGTINGAGRATIKKNNSTEYASNLADATTGFNFIYGHIKTGGAITKSCG